MAQALTKKHLDEVVKGLNGRFDNLEATMKGNTQDIISHFIQSQGFQNERMDTMDKRFDQVDDQLAEINVKLDAITKMLVMRQEMHNLIRELRVHGMPLDEGKIFIV